MNINDLDKIQKVDAPPYLYEKILNRIEDSKKSASLSTRVKTSKVISPLGVRWAIAASFIFIAALNVGAFVKLTQTQKSDSISMLAKSMRITQTNSLYQ
ncbi:MAG: hypothetical protein HQ472_06665 [Ignavibacteria bacterium]|nr:hypothetical protein [Ignavibacteria bacterium]